MAMKSFYISSIALTLLCVSIAAVPCATAGEYKVQDSLRIEYKAVFGQVESRDTALARARIGGTIVSLDVEEGASVKAGDVIATVVDDKLSLHLDSMDAHLKELHAQLDNATTELTRGQALIASGTIPKSQFDALKTQVDVLTNQIGAAEADRAVIIQQATEGKVLAPTSGRVLTVPVTKGSVVLPGETIVRIASGGYFLRLSIPERHAARLHDGDEVLVGSRGLTDTQTSIETARKGKIVKVYPELDAGRVLADAEVDGLGDFFVGERTLVWIPIGERNVTSVPSDSLSLRYGVDYVRITGANGPSDVAVIVGETVETPQGKQTEILSGIRAGDKVIAP